jgi:membrane fusion protein, peptide pheromone/bacteriocin exporter
MPSQKPFPKINSGHVIEYPILHNTQTPQLIYIATVIVFLVLVVSLPIVTIPISVKSPALIRPTSEISAIRSLVNGRIKQSFIIENKAVKKDETLYMIESEVMTERETLLFSKIDEIKLFVSDFKNLLSKDPNPKVIYSPMLRQSFFSFQQRVQESTTRYNKVLNDYNRNLKLHNQAVIADSEFENFTFELDKAKNDLELVRQNQLSQWQTELRTLERELLDLQGQLNQLQKEKGNLTIKAPSYCWSPTNNLILS